MICSIFIHIHRSNFGKQQFTPGTEKLLTSRRSYLISVRVPTSSRYVWLDIKCITIIRASRDKFNVNSCSPNEIQHQELSYSMYD